MSKDDSIAVALRQPAGAEFHRCALQVNPRHYSGTYRGRPSAAGDDAAYPQALVEREGGEDAFERPRRKYGL